MRDIYQIGERAENQYIPLDRWRVYAASCAKLPFILVRLKASSLKEQPKHLVALA